MKIRGNIAKNLDLCTKSDIVINALYHKAAVKMGISDSVQNILYVICEKDGIVYLKQGKGKQFASEKIRPLYEAENNIWNEWTPEEQKQYLALTKKDRDGLKKHLKRI